MLDPAATLALTERVADAARRLGFDTALIGAAALAAHRYMRGTEDIDLAVAVNPSAQLPALEQVLAESGLCTRLRLPDDDDPLDGVLSIWSSEDEDGEPAGMVKVVNFFNPGRPGRNPAWEAIARSVALGWAPADMSIVGRKTTGRWRAKAPPYEALPRIRGRATRSAVSWRRADTAA